MADTKATGNWGEQLTVDYLITEGYTILERNWRAGHLEVDIIAAKGEDIIFCEVKVRSEMDVYPALAVDARKQAHIIAAAKGYMSRFRGKPLRYRFDVSSINGTPDRYQLQYLPNSFRPPLRTSSVSRPRATRGRVR